MVSRDALLQYRGVTTISVQPVTDMTLWKKGNANAVTVTVTPTVFRFAFDSTTC